MQVVHKEDGTVEVSHKAGMWKPYPSPIVALVEECKIKLGIVTIARAGTLLDASVGEELGMSPATISRIRHGRQPIPQVWLLRLHVWSQMPLADVEALANVKSRVQPHRSLKEK